MKNLKLLIIPFVLGAVFGAYIITSVPKAQAGIGDDSYRIMKATEKIAQELEQIRKGCIK